MDVEAALCGVARILHAVMDKYSMFIVAKYFKTRQDYINLMAVCKKYSSLVEMFRYNPIDDTALFAMIQTQHFYSRDYLRYKRDGMAGYVYWFEADQDEWFARKANEIYKAVTLQNKGVFMNQTNGKDSEDENESNESASQNDTSNGNTTQDDNDSDSDEDNRLWNCPLPVVNGEVTVPEGITKLGWCCFSCCTGVTKITLPSTLREIEGYAFEVTSIRDMTIPEGVTSIGESCFKECFSLNSIHFPRSIREIGPWCVHLCGTVPSVTIPRECTVGEEGLHDVDDVKYY